MADELSHRRKLRHLRTKRPLVPPPMDGSIEQVIEDLTVMQGMAEEVVAEVQHLPEVPPQLHHDVKELHIVATRALDEARKETP